MAAPAAWGGAATKMAWSEQVDEEEEQNGPLDQAFPTLGEAVKTVQKVGKKKNKGTTLSLNEFMTAPKPGVFAAGSAARGTVRATEDKSILLSLPTGSRGKVEGEEQPAGALGGAFRDYGGDRGRGGGFGSRDGDDDRPPREASRADEADDWGAMRKFVPGSGGGGGGGGGGSRGFGSGGFGDRDRPAGGGFGDRDRLGGGGFEDRPPRREFTSSAADEVADWGSTRKFTPSSGGPPAGGAGGGERGGSFSGGGYREREPIGGGGFRDRDGPPRREGGGFTEGPSRADEESTWGRGRSFAPSADAAPRGTSGDRGGARGYGFGNEASSAADTEDRWARGAPQGEPSAAAAAPAAPSAPAERPRLKLAARTKPVEPIVVTEPAAGAAEAAAPSPAAAAATDAPAEEAAGGEQAANGDVAAAAAPAEKPKKSNPFGAARPREEVLKEKGVDYKKEELKLEHGEVIRDKAPEETELEKEVEDLRVKLEAFKELTPGETDTLETMAAELDDKEKALYKLQAELDDKVRFSKGKPEPREQQRPAELDPRAGDFEPARTGRGSSSGGSAGERSADGARGPRDSPKEGGPRDGPRDGPRGDGPRGGGGPRERSRDRRDGPPGAPRDGSRDRRGGGRGPAPLPRPGAERERAW